MPYVRGSTVQFYELAAQQQASAPCPRGPAVWICGDCHVGNLGPIAAADGSIAIQIRDLDQTVIGNPAHDLIRPGPVPGHRRAGLPICPAPTTAHMLEEMDPRAMQEALADDDAARPEPASVKPGPQAGARRASGGIWPRSASLT